MISYIVQNLIPTFTYTHLIAITKLSWYVFSAHFSNMISYIVQNLIPTFTYTHLIAITKLSWYVFSPGNEIELCR